MPDHGPVFVDFYGTGRGGGGGGPPEPFWKAAWHGRAPLWKAFWGGFVFGQGVLLALGLGAMLLATMVGMVASPQNLDAVAAPAGIVGVAAALIAVPYLVWASVAVWRCAPNSRDRNWGRWSRIMVVVYWAFVAYLVVKGALL